MKKAIFTVVFGGYDNVPAIPVAEGWEKVIITDTERPLTGWDRVLIAKPTNNPALESRRYKWLSHIYLKEYDLVCYFDGNMSVIKTPPEHPFRIRHYKRNTVRQECDALNRQLHRATIEDVEAHYASLIADGFPDESGLYLNGFFARDHSEKENKFCEKVWESIQYYTNRDMVTIPYVIWKTGHEIKNEKGKEFFESHIKMNAHRITKPALYVSPRHSIG